MVGRSVETLPASLLEAFGNEIDEKTKANRESLYNIIPHLIDESTRFSVTHCMTIWYSVRVVVDST